MLNSCLILVLLASSVAGLTCYNGMKTLAMQAVGQSTEECSPSAYCYNMSASGFVLVNFVKAGCSTWRCMLARDTCIFTTFQAVPVSLCCCSTDRCNVGGNPVYSDKLRNAPSQHAATPQITGGGSNFNNNGGSGGSSNWGSKDSNMNNNGWGNNNDADNQQSTFGGSNAQPEDKFTKEKVEKTFRDFSIDDRGDEIQLENDFKKADPKKEMEKTAIPSGTSPKSTPNRKSGDIEI